MYFTVTTEGRDRLKLRQLIQDFADSQWVPAHYNEDDAVYFIWDQFKRTLAAEMEMIQVTCDVRHSP